MAAVHPPIDNVSYPVDTIRHVGGYDDKAYTYYPVLVIGAGESGIAMGCRLRQELGFDQFRIFERKSGIGGTWYTNRYPGIACDVLAICYSYSFAQNPNWTSLHPSGPEILDYLYKVCAKFQIQDKIQVNTDVTAIKWLEDVEEWEVTVAHMAPGAGDLSSAERKELAASKGQEAVVLRTETVRAKVVASAVGGLVEPKPYPDIPGLESFEGEIVHTARWKPALDVSGKDVIVLGTGCSGAQVVPELVKPECNAKSVTQLMRSPGWTQPTFPPEVQAWWAKWMPKLCTYIPGFQPTVRRLMFTLIESEFLTLFRPTEAARQNREKKAEELIGYLKSIVPEEYHEILTPDYEVGCKRRIIDTDWFRSLQNPKIDLTTLPLTRINAKSVTLGPGRNYPPMSRTDSKAPTDEKEVPADVIVFANGYEAGEWLHPLDVTGKGGRSLYDVWNERGGSQAYMGTAMDGFPNFWLIFGPNTATGHSSVILASENMVNYSLKFIKPILQGDVKTYEVKERAERQWTENLQRLLKNSVWMSGGCTSWYRKGDWNATIYPRSQIDFTLRCMFPRYSDWDVSYTRKGLIKYRVFRTLAYLATFSTLLGIVWSFRAGKARTKAGISSGLMSLRNYILAGIDGMMADQIFNFVCYKKPGEYATASQTEEMTKLEATQAARPQPHPQPRIFQWELSDAQKDPLQGTFPTLPAVSCVSGIAQVRFNIIVRLGTDDMAEHASNYESGTKRKSEDGERNSRAKRNRYISIACNECKRRKIKCNGEASNPSPLKATGTRPVESFSWKKSRPADSFADTMSKMRQPFAGMLVYSKLLLDFGQRLRGREFQQVRSHISSLQEQVDSLYANLNSLREQQHDTYSPIEQPYMNEGSRSLSMSGANARTLPPLRKASEQKSLPQFHGPTSSVYGFDVAKTSLQIMGINQDPSSDEGAIFEDGAPTPAPLGADRDLPPHPGKDPIWSIDQAHAIRLARMYEEECGLMYPLFEIEYIIKHIKLLYSYIEAALRTGFTQMHLPGASSIEDEDTNLTKMVLAIGLVLEGDGKSQTADAIYDSLRPVISEKIMGPADMKGVCLLVLTSTFRFHRDEEGKAWRHLGIAARLCYEIGLHRKDSLLKTFTNEAEYQNAVRVFWSVYALDRRWSFGTGMPFALQDADIDPLLPEPDDTNLYLKHVTMYNKITSKVWSYNSLIESGGDSKRDEIGFLDYQVLQWYQQIPESLTFDVKDVARENEIPNRGQRKLRLLMFLRLNLARIQIYRPILHSATSILANRQYAQKVIDVAKETISVLIRVNQTSDLYRTQQVVYNYFLIQALAVIFLATSHAPAEFFRQTRDEFYGALDLIKGFSTRSYISKRLWTTIRGLKELGEKIGALARGTNSVPEPEDAHSNAAVAMVGLAGSSIDDLGMYGAGNRKAATVNELGVSPMDGQQMSNELITLFELAGGYGNFATSPGSQGYNGYLGANGEIHGGGEGVNAFFGNEQEFSRIMGELI